MIASKSNRIYTLWCLMLLVGWGLLLFPFIFICINLKKMENYAFKSTRLWADMFFFTSGLLVKTDHRFKPQDSSRYIFVANHFSYLDIVVGMKVVGMNVSFLGKKSLTKLPIFGYIFSKLHIQVGREDKNSRSRAIRLCKEVLSKNRSLFIMPEGGIVSESIPSMNLPFKDGAFYLSLDSNVPIVPITFLNNYKIMPERSDNNIFWDFPRVVVHEPLSPIGKTMDELKQEVYDVIQTELDNYGDRYRNH